MEDIRVIQRTEVDRVQHLTLRQKIVGATTLTLVFIASAAFTLAHLTDTRVPQASQVATAAVLDPISMPSLVAEAAYAVDLTTGNVLFSKNADVQLPLASLTKVPLVLVVSEVLPPQSSIRIQSHITPDGAPARLTEGLQFSAEDLIAFTLVTSSNEGAEIISKAARAAMSKKYQEADTRDPVLWRMNDLVKDLGLSHTFFLNSNGLDLSETQAGAYGSARDVAVIFGYAASTSPSAFEHTARDRLSIRAKTGETINAINTDESLPSIPGMIIGKTGYTDLAGGNLAIVFEVGPAHPIVAVILHSTQDGRFSDMEALVAAIQKTIAANP